MADSWESLGFAFKRDGSLNIRRTVFNIALRLSRLDGSVEYLPASVWGDNPFTAEQIEAYCFEYDIDIELSQVKSALLYWCRRGVIIGNGRAERVWRCYRS